MVIWQCMRHCPVAWILDWESPWIWKNVSSLNLYNRVLKLKLDNSCPSSPRWRACFIAGLVRVAAHTSLGDIFKEYMNARFRPQTDKFNACTRTFRTGATTVSSHPKLLFFDLRFDFVPHGTTTISLPSAGWKDFFCDKSIPVLWPVNLKGLWKLLVSLKNPEMYVRLTYCFFGGMGGWIYIRIYFQYNIYVIF